MTQPARTKPAFLRHLPLAVILGVAAIGAFALRDHLSFDTLRDNRESLLALREAHYAALAGGFLLAYVAIVAFSLPGASVASVTGGFLFGLVAGTALNVAAASIGAVLIFLAARAGLGQTLSARMDTGEGRLARLRQALRDNEIPALLLLRLVPVVPFFVANLLPALVGARLHHFAWTTAVGIVPGALVFTSIGVGVGEVFDRGENPDLGLLWSPQVLGPLLGLALLAALPMLIRAIRGRKDI